MVESVLIGGAAVLLVVGVLLIYYFHELRKYERARDAARREDGSSGAGVR